MSSEDLSIDSEQQQTFVTQSELSEQFLSYEEYYAQLNRVISQIDTHFQSTLKQHERNFIKAYKGQMLKVEKELKFLKAKQAEQAGKLMQDDDITNLQTSIAWFKSEAVKLNQILEAQKQKMQTSKYTLMHCGKEQQQITEGLKEVRRENKLIQMAIQKTQEQNRALKEFFARSDDDQCSQFDI